MRNFITFYMNNLPTNPWLFALVKLCALAIFAVAGLMFYEEWHAAQNPWMLALYGYVALFGASTMVVIAGLIRKLFTPRILPVVILPVPVKDEKVEEEDCDCVDDCDECEDEHEDEGGDAPDPVEEVPREKTRAEEEAERKSKYPADPAPVKKDAAEPEETNN